MAGADRDDAAMTAPDITPENVARMLEGVTPGPWCVVKRYSFICHKDTWQVVWYVPNSTALATVLDTGGDAASDEADARFIAWAREAVPALAARLAEVEAELAASEVSHTAASDLAGIMLTRAEAVEAAEARVARLREALIREALIREASDELTRLVAWINEDEDNAFLLINAMPLELIDRARAALEETKE
jgi:hypothetical protein